MTSATATHRIAVGAASMTNRIPGIIAVKSTVEGKSKKNNQVLTVFNANG
jgi:hypothetical protein